MGLQLLQILCRAAANDVKAVIVQHFLQAQPNHVFAACWRKVNSQRRNPKSCEMPFFEAANYPNVPNRG